MRSFLDLWVKRGVRAGDELAITGTSGRYLLASLDSFGPVVWMTNCAGGGVGHDSLRVWPISCVALANLFRYPPTLGSSQSL
jgi:hypothetical protein